MELTIICIAAYLIGSIPTAVALCALLGKGDPRLAGSGNPGATNVARLHGKALGAAVFALDFTKGLAATLGAGAFIGSSPLGEWASALSLVCVCLGHAKSIFLKFSGGKSVATGFGALLVIAPWLGIGAVAVWLLVFAIWRISGLSAVSAYAALAPMALGLSLIPARIVPGLPLDLSGPLLLGLTLVSALVLVRHRSNYPVIASKLAARRAGKG